MAATEVGVTANLEGDGQRLKRAVFRPTLPRQDTDRVGSLEGWIRPDSAMLMAVSYRRLSRLNPLGSESEPYLRTL
jgi:hypothetical protein